MSSRKRRAPGASPQVRQQPEVQNNIFTQNSNLPTEAFLNTWNDTTTTSDIAPTFTDGTLYDGAAYTGTLGGSAGQSAGGQDVLYDEAHGRSFASIVPDPASYSGQLVRRNPNQQLAARGRTAWDAFAAEGSPGQQGGWDNTDEDEDLEQKAMLARKDAQAKRKQIPPFVQKLSSFLDEKNNTNLIRWSDDGNSFIVLDEDEFARTLIPELFKHNNYASFVRQLNMYGFHKKVGLSDNSMKASETKAKAPSEYYNKYFKRGRPELLWLIQKPKNPSSNPKRKREDDPAKHGDSDDDGRRYVVDSGGGPAHHANEEMAARNQEMAMIPRTEYNSLRGEVRALQQQQKIISGVLNRIRQQNDQLYQQTTAFQTLHDRHENSINAILTFLATFYNRSLEGNNGPNISDMFATAIAQSQQHQQPHGNVVDVEEYPEKPINKSPQLHRTARRPLALLPAPAPKNHPIMADRAATVSPSIRSAASPLPRPSPRPSIFRPGVQSGRSSSEGPVSSNHPSPAETAPTFPSKVDNTRPPQNFNNISEAEEIMSAIQNINASQATTQGPQFDFGTALTHYQTAGGHTPLTQQQRSNVLSQMANSTDAIASNSSISQGDNALVSPQPPAVPSLDQFAATAAQLDMLQKMSEEQNSRVQNLQQRLEPLSPSGTIPGLTDNSYFSGAPLADPTYDELDLHAFVESDDYFPTTQNGATATGALNLPDLDYTLTGTEELSNGIGSDGQMGRGATGFAGGDAYRHAGNGTDGGGRIESVSSAATSPAVTVEDEVGDEERRSPKRRRK